jgi:hypothetical protein
MTEVVMRTLDDLSRRHHVPILPPIRQDVEVVKTAKFRKFLADRAPNSRALLDYNEAFKQLLSHMENGNPEAQLEATS